MRPSYRRDGVGGSDAGKNPHAGGDHWWIYECFPTVLVEDPIRVRVVITGATGNVVFAQGDNRISAERAEFNTQTRLGTFYNASGIAAIQPPKRAPTTRV